MTLSNRPAERPVVVLCGSVTRAVAALDAAERHYLAEGYRVHKPIRNDAVSAEQHAEWQYGRIASCDPERDLVVGCGMQHADVGAATRREIGDALLLGKRVRFWVEPAPPKTWTCPACRRTGRTLDPQGRIRWHHDGRTHAAIRCVGTGQRPDHAEERAS